jgi:hypothetical protein
MVPVSSAVVDTLPTLLITASFAATLSCRGNLIGRGAWNPSPPGAAATPL